MACAVDQSATVSYCASWTCHITNGAYSAARAATVCITPASSGIRNFTVDTIMTGRTFCLFQFWVNTRADIYHRGKN